MWLVDMPACGMEEGGRLGEDRIFLSQLPKNVLTSESKNQEKLKKPKLKMSWIAKELN